MTGWPLRKSFGVSSAKIHARGKNLSVIAIAD